MPSHRNVYEILEKFFTQFLTSKEFEIGGRWDLESTRVDELYPRSR